MEIRRTPTHVTLAQQYFRVDCFMMELFLVHCRQLFNTSTAKNARKTLLLLSLTLTHSVCLKQQTSGLVYLCVVLRVICTNFHGFRS